MPRIPVAMVTGAGQGIGRACALELAAAGHDVVVNDIVADAAEETARMVDATGRRALVVVADVMDDEAVEGMASRAADELGDVDVLVNNAGGAPGGTPWEAFAESSLTDVQRFLELNLGSALRCTRAVLPGMLDRGSGHIVSVNSISAVLGQAYGVAYATAKAALTGFTTSLSKEVASAGVRVNEIVVGNAPHPSRADARQVDLDGWTHLRRVGRTEEFARVIAFLVSDAASYVTGASVPVDGGLSKPQL